MSDYMIEPNKMMRLRVPTMWAVLNNSFGDIEPIVEDGRIRNSQYFDADLLTIERMRPVEHGAVTQTRGHLFDLDWIPYGKPDGSYRLKFMHGSRDNMLFEFASQNRHLICILAEQALRHVAQGLSDEEVSLRLHQTAAQSEESSKRPGNGKSDLTEEERLMPLRVPNTWAVVHNSFGDVDPLIEDGRILNSQYFDGGLLTIQRLRYVKGEGYATVPEGFLLTLAWLPAGDPNGSYRLALVHGVEGNSVFTFSSPDRYKMRTLIEEALVLAMTAVAYFQGLPHEEIRARLEQTAAQPDTGA